MSSPEETNTGPVIRDRRRIDPVTGQVKEPGMAASGQSQPGRPRAGKHAASRPGGTGGSGGSTPAGGSGRAGGRPDNGAAGSRPGPAGAAPGEPAPPGPGEAAPGGAGGSDLAAALAERTADLQRVSAEYANYRKRVDRDRLAVREQALANVLAALIPVLDDIGRAREHGELAGGFKSVAESLEAVTAKLGLESFGEAGEPFDPTVHEALIHSYSGSVTEPTCVELLQPGYRVGQRILRPARVAVAEPGDSPEDADGSEGSAARPGPPETDGD